MRSFVVNFRMLPNVSKAIRPLLLKIRNLFWNRIYCQLTMFAYRAASLRIVRHTSRRLKSSVPMEEASSGWNALVGAVGATFGTYCLADFLSNFIQHPTQAMDYGYFNQVRMLLGVVCLFTLLF